MNKTLNNKCDYKHQWIKRMIFGFLMGISDAIPGYSGGTTLTLLNFYDNLVENTKGVFKPQLNTKRWQHFLWILPFFIFWAIFFILVNFAVKEISKANFEDFLVVLFASFAISCIPIFVLVNKPKVFCKRSWKPTIAFIIGFLLILIISLIIFFLKLNETNSTLTSYSSILELWKANPGRSATFIFSALVGGFFLLIPGISGSMVVYLFNEYWTLNSLITNPFANGNIAFLLLFAVMLIIGVICSVIFSSWMIKKYHDIFYGLAFGMVAVSFIAILLISPISTWEWSENINLHIGLICLAIIVGIGLNIIFILIYLKKHKVLKQINKF